MGSNMENRSTLPNHRDVRALACLTHQCFLPSSKSIMAKHRYPFRAVCFSHEAPVALARPSSRATIRPRERCRSWGLRISFPTRAAFHEFPNGKKLIPAGNTGTWIDLVQSNPPRRASGPIRCFPPWNRSSCLRTSIHVMNHRRRSSYVL